MPCAICNLSSLRVPRRITHIAVSGPAVLKRKLNCRSAKSGRTVSSSFGSGIVFNDGSTSPISPGRYQRAPSLCRKPDTALKLPRSSSPQISSDSPFAVVAPSGLPVSPGSLSRFLYKPGPGMPQCEFVSFSHSACARGMSPLFFAKGSMGVNSVSSPISTIQSAPVAMRYAPSFSPSAVTFSRSVSALRPTYNFTGIVPPGCVTIGSFAPEIFST